MHQYQQTPTRNGDSSKLNQIETLSKNNFNDILQLISDRIKMIKQQSKIIDDDLELKKLQIERSKPSQILMHNTQNYNLLKYLVNSAYKYNCNDDHDSQQYANQNERVEQEVNIKGKEMSAIYNQITSLMEIEEKIITQIEKCQVALKFILKSKGSLNQAEKKETERKNLITKLRNLRENLSKLKTEEVQRIRSLIDSHDKLATLRKRRAQSIENLQGLKLQSCIELLSTFILNLNSLLKRKTNLRKSNEQDYLSNTRKSIFIPNEYSSSKKPHDLVKPFTLTQKNQNAIGMKSSEIFRQYTQEKGQNYNKSLMLQDIILQYQNMFHKISDLKEMEKIYLRNKQKVAEDQCKILAYEKTYLVGILGWNPQDSSHSYQAIINEAIDRAGKYIQKLQMDVKQKNNIKLKMQDMHQAVQFYHNKIQESLKQGGRKKALAAQIQGLMSQFRNNSKKTENMKQIFKQIEQKKLEVSLMEKEQQDFAELGDLENYKKTSFQIQNLQKVIKGLQRTYIQYSCDPTNQKQDGQAILTKIQDAIMKSNLDFHFDRIKEARLSPNQVVQRIYKRLLPI